MLAIFAPTSGAQLSSDIAAADTNGDASNTINLAAADYQVDNLLIQNQNAAVPTKTLTIVGQGETSSILDGAGIARVLDINASNGRAETIVLQNLAIEHGKAVASSGAAAQGGGVFATGQNAQVTLSNVAVRSNVASGNNGAAGGKGSGANVNGSNGQAGGAAQGGGIYLASGTISLHNCTIADNKAQGGAGGTGGRGAPAPRASRGALAKAERADFTRRVNQQMVPAAQAAGGSQA